MQALDVYGMMASVLSQYRKEILTEDETISILIPIVSAANANGMSIKVPTVDMLKEYVGKNEDEDEDEEDVDTDNSINSTF